MGFNSWIYAEPAGPGAETHGEEIDSLAKAKLASEIQTKVRARIDPGIDLRNASRAQAVRSYADEGNIVIDEKDQAELITGEAEDAGPAGTSTTEASTMDDLYSLGSGIPEIIADPDGTTRISFRTIKASSLFGDRQADQDDTVQSIVTDTLQMGIVDAIDEATSDVNRRYPEK